MRIIVASIINSLSPDDFRISNTVHCKIKALKFNTKFKKKKNVVNVSKIKNNFLQKYII